MKTLKICLSAYRLHFCTGLLLIVVGGLLVSDLVSTPVAPVTAGNVATLALPLAVCMILFGIGVVAYTWILSRRWLRDAGR